MGEGDRAKRGGGGRRYPSFERRYLRREIHWRLLLASKLKKDAGQFVLHLRRHGAYCLYGTFEQLCHRGIIADQVF